MRKLGHVNVYTKNKIIQRQKEIAKQAEVPSLEVYRLQPNSMQVGFINNLRKIYEAGEDKALLISATGTGKTYASAFAARELEFKKVLFLVHRNQIAKQALKSYRKVFDGKVSMGMVTGKYQDYDADFVFVTVQILSKEDTLIRYEKEHWDLIIIDELHTQPNRKLFDVMTKGSGDARTQPLYFLITTAGTDTNSICYETHQKVKDIIEGRKIDPTFYPVIYGADEDDDWTDPKVWKKANPSLGITVSIDKVQAACDSAKQNPGEENAFRQLRLNQWVKQAVRWMPMDKWDACNFNINEDDLEGRICYGGLDLSSTTDITAFVLVFPPRDEDDKFAILPYFWIPEDTLELRVRRDHVPYDVWEKQGYLMTTEGNVVHYGFIEKFIERLGERFNIREIAFDRWGAVQMVQNLEGMGFTAVPFGQGFKDMSPPTKELMKLTLEKKLAHGGHPVLRLMMDNIYIRNDPAGNIKADKEKSTEKIDGAIATIMGLDRAIRCGNDVSASVYDERGILFI